jgi:glycosyltransferase involved in cell wall biosynthesis
MKRLLLLAPVAEAGFVGGLQLALADLRCELENRGWEIEAPLYAGPNDTLAPSITPAPPLIAAMQTSSWLLRCGRRIPVHRRLTVYDILRGRSAYENAARNLRWAEERLQESKSYDVVMVCVDWNVRGMLALALARHQRVAVLSLGALAGELRPAWWSLVRLRARHPFHYAPAKPEQIRCAIFASQRWREEAVSNGLPAAVAHTIHFGIPLGARPKRRPTPRGRSLLWVGRLAPEKGLHLLLEALPALRKLCPGVTLTVVGAQGEQTYYRMISSMITSHGLQDAVTLRPAIPRDQLPELYAEHDALFFYSIYGEPVALVLMEAYASGLPVAANHASSDLVQDGVTCLTYDAGEAGSIVRVLHRLLSESSLRARLAASARERVEKNYGLHAMGDAYDRLLYELSA